MPSDQRLRVALLLLAVLAACSMTATSAAAAPGSPAAPAAPAAPAPDADQLARTLADLVAHAIPEAYEKKEDWGATKEITVGLKFQGKGLKQDLRRRRKAVKHGVWKHYELKLVEPEQNLVVRIDELRPAGPGRLAYAIHIDAKIDAWCRAKVYQYGVHVISLEAVGDSTVHIAVAGEAALRVDTAGERAGLALDPVVASARIDFEDFRLRRVSDAHGLLVRELGRGIERLLEDKLDEPTLVAKLNRAIDKKRDRLRLDFGAAAALATLTPAP